MTQDRWVTVTSIALLSSVNVEGCLTAGAMTLLGEIGSYMVMSFPVTGGFIRKKNLSEAGSQVAEFKVLRFSLGVTRMDRIRKEHIRGTAQVGHFGDKERVD